MLENAFTVVGVAFAILLTAIIVALIMVVVKATVDSLSKKG